jgi:hypothetical protein
MTAFFNNNVIAGLTVFSKAGNASGGIGFQ